MGLFFERRTPNAELVSAVANAYRTQPPAEDGTHQEELATLVTQLGPLTRTLTAALKAAPPDDTDAKATEAAQAAVDELLGGPSFNTGRFLVALLIFGLLLGGGIATEATHLTTASGTLFGFAGTIFGVVTAFLGTEKSST